MKWLNGVFCWVSGFGVSVDHTPNGSPPVLEILNPKKKPAMANSAPIAAQADQLIHDSGGLYSFMIS